MPFDNETDLKRRNLIGGAGHALAAATLARPAFSQESAIAGQNGGATAQAAAPMVDPGTKYPKPPFEAQKQTWPGLAGRMNPRPDHGETSYKGSGRLMGRRALITGGDSGMGRAAAIALRA